MFLTAARRLGHLSTHQTGTQKQPEGKEFLCLYEDMCSVSIHV